MDEKIRVTGVEVKFTQTLLNAPHVQYRLSYTPRVGQRKSPIESCALGGTVLHSTDSIQV